jgi:3-hydroxyisobutyrate dehydrogenase
MPAAASGWVGAVAELIGMLPGAGLDRPAPSKCWLRPPVASRGAATAMLGDTFPAGFPIELVTKDLEYASADAALLHTAADTYRQRRAPGRARRAGLSARRASAFD